MRFDFSDHAVRRYIKRHAPNASWAEAHEALVRGSSSAVLTKETAKGGARVWELPALGDVLAVGQIRQQGPEKVVAVITILPAMQHLPEDDFAEEELKRYAEEYHQRMEALRAEEAERERTQKQQEKDISAGKQRAELTEEGQALRRARETFGQQLQRLQVEGKLRRDAAVEQRLVLELEVRIIEARLKMLINQREQQQANLKRQAQLHAQSVQPAKEALRVALRFLKTLPASLTADVMAEIASFGPGLVTDAFIKPEGVRTQTATQHDLTCPDCGAKMRLRPSKYGLFYGCEKYPDCRGTHGAHPDGTPLGTPAPAALREARKVAHQHFDQLWKGNGMTRSQAYAWLAQTMGMTEDEAHIGRFDLAQCERLIELVPSVLSAKSS